VLCPICAAKPEPPCALCQGRHSALAAAAAAAAAAEAAAADVGGDAGGGGGGGGGPEVVGATGSPTDWCCR